jgi:hypothetical protein
VTSGSQQSQELVSHLLRILLATFQKDLPDRLTRSLFWFLGKMRLLCSKISSLLVFVYLRTQFFWIFCENFRYSCISCRRMALFRSVSLFGMLLLVEAVLLQMLSLIITSYIISIKRFIQKDLRLPSLHNLGVYLFIHHGLGTVRGLPM